MSAAGSRAPTDVTQYCTFSIGDLFFGVDVDDVQEVVRHQPMTPVPRAGEGVRGLINLRGQIVTAVDLRFRLGLAPRPADRLPMNVIVRSHGEVVSLLVDDIGDVVGTAGLVLEQLPSNLPVELRRVVHAVRQLPDRLLLVLDADRAVEVPAAETA